MVPAIVSALLLLLLAIAPARAGLDLTPQAGTVMREYLPEKVVFFHDGPAEITYRPPKQWTYEGGISSVTLRPPDRPLAGATLSSSPRLRVTMDDAGVKAIKANPALLGIPKEATGVVIKDVELNSVKVGGHDTIDAEVAFIFFGQSRLRNVLLVNRKGAEVSIILDAPAADYPGLKRQFRQSLYTLNGF